MVLTADDGEKMICRSCQTSINSNRFHHRARLCLECEMHEEAQQEKIRLDMFGKVRSMDEVQLESSWQCQSMVIRMSLTEYYKSGELRLKKVAEDAQQFQEVIQEEITRRHRARNS